MSFRLRWTALFCDEMISLGLILVNPVLQCGTVSDCFWVYVVFLEIPLCFLHLKTKLCPDLGVLPFWPLGCPPISPTSTSIFHSACSAPILLVYGYFSSPMNTDPVRESTPEKRTSLNTLMEGTLTLWPNVYSFIRSLFITASFLLKNKAFPSSFDKRLSSHLLWLFESIW